MRPSNAGKVVAALLTAVLAVPAQSCAAEPPPAPQPTPVVGDVFTYNNKFASVKCAEWTVTATDQNGMVVSRCGDDTAYNMASNGALVRILGKGGKKLVEFTPFSPSLQFPLQVGKTWTGKYVGYTEDDGNTWVSDQTCKVAAFETVQVPAGVMPTYKVVCNDAWTSGPFSGTSSLTSWYAPQAHVIVKQRGDDSKWRMDLARYTLH